MLRLTSLGARLVLGVILVAALGLALADVATYASLRSFLFHRTDSAGDADAAEAVPSERLTQDQLARVHDLALEKARALDLPEAQAGLLADAMVGSLAAA